MELMAIKVSDIPKSPDFKIECRVEAANEFDFAIRSTLSEYLEDFRYCCIVCQALHKWDSDMATYMDTGESFPRNDDEVAIRAFLRKYRNKFLDNRELVVPTLMPSKRPQKTLFG